MILGRTVSALDHWAIFPNAVYSLLLAHPSGTAGALHWVFLAPLSCSSQPTCVPLGPQMSPVILPCLPCSRHCGLRAIPSLYWLSSCPGTWGPAITSTCPAFPHISTSWVLVSFIIFSSSWPLIKIIDLRNTYPDDTPILHTSYSFSPHFTVTFYPKAYACSWFCCFCILLTSGLGVLSTEFCLCLSYWSQGPGHSRF